MKRELDNISRKLVEEACLGNIQAIKLVLERTIPAKKSRDIEIALPALETSSDALKAIAAIIAAVSCGNITPSEGEDLSKIVDSFVRAIEAYDLEKRIKALEMETKKYDEVS